MPDFRLSLLAIFLFSFPPAFARPLTLEALLQQKRPATTAVSSRGEVAYIIEPRFNPDLEVTVDRRGTIEGEVFVWTEGQMPPRALGKGTDFLKYSPDGAWLATAVAKGDGYVFRLISREDGSVADIGWTDRGFFSCGWTSQNQFVFRESLPTLDDAMQVMNTVNESLDPISRLVLFDPRTGGSKVLDDLANLRNMQGWRRLKGKPS